VLRFHSSCRHYHSDTVLVEQSKHTALLPWIPPGAMRLLRADTVAGNSMWQIGAGQVLLLPLPYYLLTPPPRAAFLPLKRYRPRRAHTGADYRKGAAALLPQNDSIRLFCDADVVVRLDAVVTHFPTLIFACYALVDNSPCVRDARLVHLPTYTRHWRRAYHLLPGGAADRHSSTTTLILPLVAQVASLSPRHSRQTHALLLCTNSTARTVNRNAPFVFFFFFLPTRQPSHGCVAVLLAGSPNGGLR